MHMCEVCMPVSAWRRALIVALLFSCFTSKFSDVARFPAQAGDSEMRYLFGTFIHFLRRASDTSSASPGFKLSDEPQASAV